MPVSLLFTQTVAMATLFAPERRLRTPARLSHQGGEMITQRFGLMKYIPVFHPFGVALRSKSFPDGFVTKDFAKEWNNRVYFQLSKMLCGFNLGFAVEHRFSAVPQVTGQGATCG